MLLTGLSFSGGTASTSQDCCAQWKTDAFLHTRYIANATKLPFLFLLALEIVPMCMESLKLPSRKYVGSEFFVLLSCLPITFQGGRPKQDSLGVMWTTSRLAH